MQDDAGWLAYILTIGLTLGAVLLSILYLKSRSGLLLTIDNRGLEFKEGRNVSRYLWSEMRAVRLCITKADHRLTLEMRGKTVTHSLQPYEKRSELIEEIIRHAEPLGLWDLPRDGTRFGLVNYKGPAIAVSAFLGVPGIALLIASFSSGDPFGPILVFAVLLLAAAVGVCLPINLTYHLRGNELIVTNLGREKRIFLDRPITYYYEGALYTLKQGGTKLSINPTFEGCYNLLWVIEKESKASRTAALLPEVPKFRRFRVRQLILCSVLILIFSGYFGLGLYAIHRVLEPLRFTAQGPATTEGWVTGKKGDNQTIFAYRANGRAYELWDFVSEQPEVGDQVMVAYSRTHPNIAHTFQTARGEKAISFTVTCGFSAAGAVLFGISAFLLVRRKRLPRDSRDFLDIGGRAR